MNLNSDERIPEDILRYYCETNLYNTTVTMLNGENDSVKCVIDYGNHEI